MKKLYPYLVLTFLFLFVSCSSDSEEPTPEPDVVAPTADFEIAGFSNSSSSEPIVASNQIQVNIDAKDAGGIAKVEAFIDDQKVGEDTTAPYQIIIDISDYTSKIAQTGKFKDYTLKIVVTDTSGNTTSKEQTINIDNELPVISEVSLEADSVINGDTNTITFNITDNEELKEVKTYLNNELLSEITDANYEINIDTQQLADGENTLKIEAVDLAENTAFFEVSFVVDNSGPEILLESLTNVQQVDEIIILEPSINDAHSDVDQVEFLFNGATELLIEDGTQYQWVFDPYLFDTGSATISIKASDNLGNESISEYPIEILRRLITINIPENFYDPQLARIYVFASSKDGRVVDTERIFQDSNQITLQTVENLGGNSKIMLTFAHYSSGSAGNYTELTTIQDLTPGNSTIFNLKVEPRFQYGPTAPYLFPSTDFDPDDNFNMNIEGFGYGGSFYASTKEVSLDRRRNTTSDVNTDVIYIPLINYTLNEYSYYLSDWMIPQDFVFTPNLFTQKGIETRTFIPQPNSFQNFSYWIAGYFDEEDFENNIYHRIVGLGYQGGGFSFPNGVPYHFNTIFDTYRYKITMDTYHTERTGIPVSTFQTLDWNIDYSIIDNHTIGMSKTGTDHTVGKVFLDKNTVVNGLNVGYSWNIVFDSDKNTQIALPDIPEEIQSWGFYPLFEEGDYIVEQVEIQKYEGIDSYDQYVEYILKNNNKSYLVSPIKEAVFKSATPTHYYNQKNFILNH